MGFSRVMLEEGTGLSPFTGIAYGNAGQSQSVSLINPDNIAKVGVYAVDENKANPAEIAVLTASKPLYEIPGGTSVTVKRLKGQAGVRYSWAT